MRGKHTSFTSFKNKNKAKSAETKISAWVKNKSLSERKFSLSNKFEMISFP